eukprot:COSAG02_NODE_18098_length_961_cov_1.126450_1_plen_134_part_10
MLRPRAGCTAEPGVPFGLAEQVSQPETKRRWRQSCREKVLRSAQPGMAVHTRLWIAEDERDGTIVGSVGIQPDPGNETGSNEVAASESAASWRRSAAARSFVCGPAQALPIRYPDAPSRELIDCWTATLKIRDS